MYRLAIIGFAILLLGSCKRDTDKSDAYGNFEAETVIVSAESGGRILEFIPEKGQKIVAGELTAITDSSAIHLNLLQLDAQKQAVYTQRQSIRAQIAVLEEKIRNLKVNLDRTKNMFQDGAATQKQLDDIQGQINVAEKQIAATQTQFVSVSSELDILEAQRASLADQLNRCKVMSPVGGTVLETYAEEGEFITPGKALYKLAELDELTLKVYVSGAQLPSVKIGQTTEVLVEKTATEKQAFEGKVTWISSEAEFTPKIIQTQEERVKLVYAVKISVPNNGTLKIGMPGEANFK